MTLLVLLAAAIFAFLILRLNTLYRDHRNDQLELRATRHQLMTRIESLALKDGELRELRLALNAAHLALARRAEETRQ